MARITALHSHPLWVQRRKEDASRPPAVRQDGKSATIFLLESAPLAESIAAAQASGNPLVSTCGGNVLFTFAEADALLSEHAPISPPQHDDCASGT